MEVSLSQDLMRYDQMTQLALRGVVRDAIRRVIREDGLPGAHHFYITFLTRFPGVEIDESLAKKYPDEITIVLEHQYWDLAAHSEHFEVTLKFGGVPKYLSVPYTAISRFHDPSVGFSLVFDAPEDMKPSAPEIASIAPVEKAAKPAEKASKSKPATKPKTAAKKKAKLKVDNPTDDDTPPEGGPKVVSLDAFRKK